RFDPASLERDEEEDMDPLQPERLDGEEIARDGRGRSAGAGTGASSGGRAAVAAARPAAARIERTEVAEIVMPRPRSSPTIRWYPQLLFSRASRSTSSRVRCSSGGRPGRVCGYVQRRATSRASAQQRPRTDAENRPGVARQRAAERCEQD